MPRRNIQRKGFSAVVDTTGLDRLMSTSTVHEVAVGLYIEGEKIMTDSKRNYVPVVTGNLMGSGTVLAPEISASGVTVKLTYDMGVANYAYLVHERPATIGQGKNKYLEKPFLAHQNQVPLNVGKYLASRLIAIAQGATTPVNAWTSYQGEADGAA